MKKIFALLLIATTGCATSIEHLVEHTQPKVVKIGIRLQKGGGSGSGVFIDDHGTVLTCAHVVNHLTLTKLFVKREEGDFVQGVVIKIDTEHDLALVSTGFKNTPYVTLGKPVVRGQQVLAFGSPLGMQHSVGVGYVGNLLTISRVYTVHSTPILPGSSGGPLIDLRGRLVGINSAMMMLNPFVPAPGYSVSVYLADIREFLRAK